MDPIASIVALYNSLLANPNNSITEDYDGFNEYSNLNMIDKHVNPKDKVSLSFPSNDENVMISQKEDIKNNQTELITVPTILLDYIKTSLGHHITIPQKKQNNITPELRVFGLIGEKEEKNKDRKKIVGSKVAKRVPVPNLIRHSLLQLKRTRLNFGSLQNSSKEDTYLVTIPSKFVRHIKDGFLQKYQEDYQEYLALLSNINRVESVRLADSLLDAESSNRRKKTIDDMISDLKKEDLLKGEDSNKSSGIRLAS